MTAQNGLPEYVERGGEIVPRQPSQADDARLYGFVVQARESRLNEFCDRTFNRPAGQLSSRRWQAMGDWVLLNFVDVGRLHSADPADSRLGHLREREGAIWMPVWDANQRRLMWTVPYIFVDSEWAMTGGREPFGFPKQLGKLVIPPRDERAPRTLEIHTTGLRTWGPDSSVRPVRVVSVTRTDDGSDELGDSWTAGSDVARLLARALPHRRLDLFRSADKLEDGVDVLLAYVGSMVNQGGLSMVLLKQFRDAFHSTRACYQAILEVVERVTDFHRGALLPGTYTVEFDQSETEPIHRDLGVGSGPQPAVCAFWMEFDFSVAAREPVLWTWDASR
jgi:hypothetical protein